MDCIANKINTHTEKIDKYNETVEVMNQDLLKGKNARNEKEIKTCYQRIKSGDISSGKIFMERNSPLTDLFENPHIRAIYNIILVALIILFFNTLIFDYLEHGRINLGLRLFLSSLNNFHIVITTWIYMQAVAITPYFFLELWADWRKYFLKNDSALSFYNKTWISLFIIFQLTFLIVPTVFICKYNFSMSATTAILTETIRFIMKNHAYVRTVVPRVLENPVFPNLPSFSKFIYFMFAPTLLYRDSYPRNKSIRWNKVFHYIFEIFLAIILISYLKERYVLTHWASFGPNTLKLHQFIQMVFTACIPGILFYLCGFYILLHCWLNAMAEIMKFGDREFYMDWWTQTRFSAFYRYWNAVVHDWLHAFVYKEFLQITGNRSISLTSVFIISAIVHEYLLSFIFGFFYPVLFVFFGIFSVCLVHLNKIRKNTNGNVFLWFSLILGNGLAYAGYSIEYFARKNCPQTMDNYYYDLFVPRSWFCNNIMLQQN